MLLTQVLSWTACLQTPLALGRLGRQATSMSPRCCWSSGFKRIFVPYGKLFSTKIVLGIETSCDDTGAAVMDETGNVLGEALHSQLAVHLKTGGIIPNVAQQLHQENVAKIVQQALAASGVCVEELSAIATTVKPGLSFCLKVGLEYSLGLVKKYKKPFIPIHHMEAHALTVRLTHPVDFPFLVLLLSGGHCILAVARGISDFLLLGQTLDIAPGDMLDKVARRLSLQTHPECSGLSGGKAIEHLAQQGNRLQYTFTLPLERYANCNFSFTGLQSQVVRMIEQQEEAEGLQEGRLLSGALDLAAAVQYTVAVHIAKRTLRGIIFCRRNGLLPQGKAILVASGGVASNQYIRRALQIVGDATDVTLLCPPPRLCTDNGVMIAWNGIEKLCGGIDIIHNVESMRYEPSAPLGIDISNKVEQASIRVPAIKFTI